MEQIPWLMEGDPVIRWQTMRDLLDRPRSEWEAERVKVVEHGWVARFLAARQPDGSWPKGRWTDTMWTLIVLVDCGIPDMNPEAKESTRLFLNRVMPEVSPNLLKTVDLCHLGLWLKAGSYFLPDDPRLHEFAKLILTTQFADGGWNCRMRTNPDTIHSSFHTTFNVLEGLRVATEKGFIARKLFRATEVKAMEFMLEHHLYRSDKTGNIIDHKFTHMFFPSHWHYNILRALDYMRLTPEIKDSRLQDPIDRLMLKAKNGHWPNEKSISGKEHFPMEAWGGESRWNTLRMLRVLRARE